MPQKTTMELELIAIEADARADRLDGKAGDTVKLDSITVTAHAPNISLELAQDAAEANRLIGKMRRAAKRRKRVVAWIIPLVAVGMFSTVFILSHIDMRLSIAIFGVSAAMVALGLVGEAGQWGRMAECAAAFGDVRAIGPLLSVLNERDSSACDAIEEALIDLLPRVHSLNQLSRTARDGVNRLLLGFEMPGLRGGHNAELARAALALVANFRDCSALPAVRRLADGFTATRPAADIRDLASDILPDLEIRAALLRPSQVPAIDDRAYLRPAHAAMVATPEGELVRPTELHKT